MSQEFVDGYTDIVNKLTGNLYDNAQRQISINCEGFEVFNGKTMKTGLNYPTPESLGSLKDELEATTASMKNAMERLQGFHFSEVREAAQNATRSVKESTKKVDQLLRQVEKIPDPTLESKTSYINLIENEYEKEEDRLRQEFNSYQKLQAQRIADLLRR
ncbi:hypothetical protein H4219_002760 [Mycoemilia scoparia]|uniref:Uncharacterized protein n=1 Tax=Mycoemilia scoparia TaxID=417184 RepID=A0A9W8DNQ9_9FUNG|nr:hypothetical protein H4219_002760 [Mycoemilia scoparia]